MILIVYISPAVLHIIGGLHSAYNNPQAFWRCLKDIATILFERVF